MDSEKSKDGLECCENVDSVILRTIFVRDSFIENSLFMDFLVKYPFSKNEFSTHLEMNYFVLWTRM